MAKNVSDVNSKIWSSRSATRAYEHASGLFPAERYIFEDIAPKTAGKPILDIGVGTGRTTQALMRLSSDYVGIDYSEEMIRSARNRFPDVNFQCCDARNLEAFADNSFALVCFSYNGIDYVSHENRLQILSEILRVMNSDGSFVFSTHNRDFRDLEASRNLEGFEVSTNPVKLAYRAFRNEVSRLNSLKNKRRETESDQFAIYNDMALNHRLLTYYIGVSQQLRQLREIGFETVQAFGEQGEPLSDLELYDAGSMVYYIAQKS